jgi:hypothetical protein
MLLISRTSRISISCCQGITPFIFRLLHNLLQSLAPALSWCLRIKVRKPHFDMARLYA